MSNTPNPPTDSEFLLPMLLDHNPAVAKALRAVAPTIDAAQDWWGVCEALSGRVDALLSFPGNKSERLMLAAVLMKADYAAQACTVSADFWRAWSGLDRRNKGLFLTLIEEDMHL
jgi:hypothetical protein